MDLKWTHGSVTGTGTQVGVRDTASFSPLRKLKRRERERHKIDNAKWSEPRCLQRTGGAAVKQVRLKLCRVAPWASMTRSCFFIWLHSVDPQLEMKREDAPKKRNDEIRIDRSHLDNAKWVCSTFLETGVRGAAGDREHVRKLCSQIWFGSRRVWGAQITHLVLHSA